MTWTILPTGTCASMALRKRMNSWWRCMQRPRTVMHRYPIVVSVPITIGFVFACSGAVAGTCPAERAVYHADNVRRGFAPDELRFDFSHPSRLPFDGPSAIRLNSPEMKRELVLQTYFTNGSAVQGASTIIP